MNKAQWIGLLLLLGAWAGCMPVVTPIPEEVVFLSADVAPTNRDALDSPGAGPEDGEGGGERTVEEPDVIRQVGSLLYVLNQHRGLSIVDLDSETLVSQTPVLGYPRDLYIRDDLAYVLVAYDSTVEEGDGVVSTSPGSRLYVVDLAEITAPNLLGTLALPGDLVDSRLVGDVLYAVTSAYSWQWSEDGGAVAKTQGAETWVTSVGVGNPDAPAALDALRFDGFGTVIHVTNEKLFAVNYDWAEDRSVITEVDISDGGGTMSLGAVIAIPGAVADRFKMDVYDGVLRVVSNTNWRARETYVSTIDLSVPGELALLGQTTIPAAAGETLFATRFDGPVAYAVTFLMVDPLFVLDLSDPRNPQVVGELKVPGWSTHIEIRGDRLIALGVDDTEGWRVSVSLFDVSDPAAPGLIERLSFGEGWSWSTAYDDVKAFTVLDDVIVVPFSGWSEAGGFDRVQFLRYSRDDLSAGGHIDLDGAAIRSFSWDERFYTVTGQEIAVIDNAPDAPERSNTIVLAEYVAAYRPLASGHEVEVIRSFKDGAVGVRVLDGDAPLGEVWAPFGDVSDVHVSGHMVVLLSRHWEEEGYHEALIIDCSDGAAPEVIAQTRIPVAPWYGGWWGYRPGGVPEMAADRLWWPWFDQGGQSWIVGDYLVLRGRARSYDVTLGAENAESGLAVLKLPELEWVGTAGLGFDETPALIPVGDRLYLSTKDQYGADALGRFRCAHFISAFDPANLTMSARANVPGQLLQYDPEAGVAVCEDWQYRENYATERSLTSVQWRPGGIVALLSRFALGGSAGSIEAAGSYLYYTTYNERQRIESVRVNDGGVLSAGPRLSPESGWYWIQGAREEQVYIASGGQVIARYDFSRRPTLSGFVVVTQMPLDFYVDDMKAYGALGYGGRMAL